MRFWKLTALMLFAGVVLAQGPLGKRRPPSTHRPFPTKAREARPAAVIVRSNGRVSQVNGDTLIVQADDTRILTLNLAGSGRIDSSIVPGSSVHVEASPDQNGNLLATSVQFLSAPAIHESLVAALPPTLATGDASSAGQDLLGRAQAWAASLSGRLPDFTCKQLTTRYIYESKDTGWKATSLLSADVMYLSGRERYRNLFIDGRKTNRSMAEITGTKSTGEYAATLRDLFAPDTRARFEVSGQSGLNGVSTSVYSFRVARRDSDWKVFVGGQAIVPAFSGRVWIDPQTAHVLRIEMQADDVPFAFPLDRVEAAVEYGTVGFGTAAHFLPIHAENLACHRDTPSCDRNVVEFRNYRRFESASKIEFQP